MVALDTGTVAIVIARCGAARRHARRNRGRRCCRSTTTLPPKGAGPLSVTVPEDEVPRRRRRVTATAFTVGVVVPSGRCPVDPVGGRDRHSRGTGHRTRCRPERSAGAPAATVTLAGTGRRRVAFKGHHRSPVGAGPFNVAFRQLSLLNGRRIPGTGTTREIRSGEAGDAANKPEIAMVALAGDRRDRERRAGSAAHVTLAGTVAADVLSLDSDTTAPPSGAGPLSVTVPWMKRPGDGGGSASGREDGVDIEVDRSMPPLARSVSGDAGAPPGGDVRRWNGASNSMTKRMSSSCRAFPPNLNR
jgi:hypothetical protein